MQHDRDALESELKRWGYFKGRQIVAALEGYSPTSIMQIIREKMPAFPVLGHKVLIKDLPPDVWVTNFEVFDLPADLANALIARYCVPPRAEDGRMFTKAELAEAQGCHRSTYMRRLRRARRHLLRPRQPLDRLDSAPYRGVKSP